MTTSDTHPVEPSPQRTLRVLLVATGALALIPSVMTRPMLLHVWIMIFLAIAQGGAWNILGGYAGQHSIGHAAYFGVGAFSMMLSLEVWHFSPLLGGCLATLHALVLAGIIGT